MTAPEEQPVAPVEETAAKRKLEESAASEAEPATQEKTEEPAAKKPKTEEDIAKKEPETPAAPVKRSKGKGRSKIAQRYASEPEDEEDDEDDEEEEVIDEHRVSITRHPAGELINDTNRLYRFLRVMSRRMIWQKLIHPTLLSVAELEAKLLTTRRSTTSWKRARLLVRLVF